MGIAFVIVPLLLVVVSLAFQFPLAEEVFDRIMQMADNAGATDEHRAMNHLAVQYSAIYAKAAEEFARDFSLGGVDMNPSLLSNTGKIVEVESI